MQQQTTILSAQDRLREAGIRVTTPRVIILEYLMKNYTHPTCEQIYQAILKDNPSMAFASVYNVTDKLANVGLIKRLVSPDGEYHYDANNKYHGHFFCDKCNSIYDLSCDHEIKFEELSGAAIKNVSISVMGTCQDCLE